MKEFFWSIFICCCFLCNRCYSQSESFATVTIKADRNPISIKINGEFYENLQPGKTISFDANEGEKLHIVLEDDAGNRYVKIITTTSADRGRQFVVKFPAGDDVKVSKKTLPVKEPIETEKSPVTTKEYEQETKVSSKVNVANKTLVDEASTEPEIQNLKITTQKYLLALGEKLDKILEGKIEKDDKEVITVYNEACSTLSNVRNVLLSYSTNGENKSGLGPVKITSTKLTVDTTSLKKVISMYEAIKNGKRASSKNLIIAFNKSRAYDLHFWISKKNVTDTLIDEKPTLIYALQQGCNASVIKYLVDISGGKDEFINYDKFSFLPPNQHIYMYPLTLACINGDASVVNILIDAHARFYPESLDAKKAKEQRSFLWQQFRGNSEIRSIILQRMPDFIDPQSTALAVIDSIIKNMVYVEGGTFKMGCRGDRADCGRAWPQLETTVSSFYLSKFEVTQQQWESIMENNPTNNPGCNACPADNISWYDIQYFLEKLNQLSGKKFRLPSEKEWEFAAKGGNSSKNLKYAGSNVLDSVSWNKFNAEKAQPVGTKQPNELGLFDMSGNVFEWCNSYFTETLEIYKTSSEGATKGTERILRGGSWKEGEFFSQPTRRHKEIPSTLSPEYGFRLALDK